MSNVCGTYRASLEIEALMSRAQVNIEGCGSLPVIPVSKMETKDEGSPEQASWLVRLATSMGSGFD